MDGKSGGTFESPGEFKKYNNTPNPSPEILAELIWGGAWASVSFKSSLGDSKVQPG